MISIGNVDKDGTLRSDIRSSVLQCLCHKVESFRYQVKCAGHDISLKKISSSMSHAVVRDGGMCKIEGG